MPLRRQVLSICGTSSSSSAVLPVYTGLDAPADNFYGYRRDSLGKCLGLENKYRPSTGSGCANRTFLRLETVGVALRLGVILDDP